MSRWHRLNALAQREEDAQRRAVGAAMIAEREAQAEVDQQIEQRLAAAVAAQDPALHEQYQQFWNSAERRIAASRSVLNATQLRVAEARAALLMAHQRQRAIAALVDREQRNAALAERRRLERDVQERTATTPSTP